MFSDLSSKIEALKTYNYELDINVDSGISKILNGLAQKLLKGTSKVDFKDMLRIASDSLVGIDSLPTFKILYDSVMIGNSKKNYPARMILDKYEIRTTHIETIDNTLANLVKMFQKIKTNSSTPLAITGDLDYNIQLIFTFSDGQFQGESIIFNNAFPVVGNYSAFTSGGADVMKYNITWVFDEILEEKNILDYILV